MKNVSLYLLHFILYYIILYYILYKNTNRTKVNVLLRRVFFFHPSGCN